MITSRINPTRRPYQGFTMMETIVALGVVAIALSFFLAAFAPATLGIKKANYAQDAKDLAAGLEAELNILRPNEGTYANAFDKAFQWIARDDDQGSGLLLAFRYRANSQEPVDTDGLYPEFTDSYLEDGDTQPMIIQNCIGEIGNNLVTDKLVSAEGPVFAVKLEQLVYDNGGVLVPSGNTAEIVEPRATGTVHNDPLNYPEAVILYQAKFYRLPSSAQSYVTGASGAASFSKSQLEKAIGTRPIYTTQLGVLR